MLQRWLSRLATVRQLAISTLALALGAAAALGLVSCGGGEDAKLLPGNTARKSPKTSIASSSTPKKANASAPKTRSAKSTPRSKG